MASGSTAVKLYRLPYISRMGFLRGQWFARETKSHYLSVFVGVASDSDTKPLGKVLVAQTYRVPGQPKLIVNLLG